MISFGYSGRVYRWYQKILAAVLHARVLTIISLVVITVVCFAGFASVKQEFFPYSNTPLFYINYQLPEGTDIRTTAKDMAEIDKRIRAKAGIISVAGFVGRGAGRYILTYNPEQPNTSAENQGNGAQRSDDF